MDKPRLDQGPDYERGFIDGMMYQTETTVHRAVDAMSKRTWVGLTDEEIMVIGDKIANEDLVGLVSNFRVRLARAVEQTLKEKNHG